MRLKSKVLIVHITYIKSFKSLYFKHFLFVIFKIAFRASFVPFVKMFIDQFGYWAPCITAVYHVR